MPGEDFNLKNEGNPLGKEPIMAYKKPQMVAKSSAKKSYVAGCPVKTAYSATGCDQGFKDNNSCELVRMY